jgi:hypothetical protein
LLPVAIPDNFTAPLSACPSATNPRKDWNKSQRLGGRTMKTKQIFTVAILLLAPLLAFAEDDDKESQGIRLGFLVSLSSVECNFVAKEGELSDLYKQLETLDARTALVVAKFWRLRARISINDFLEDQLNKAKDQAPPTDGVLKRLQQDAEMGILSYYFDNWENIRKMLQQRIAIEKERPATRFSDELQRLRNEDGTAGH